MKLLMTADAVGGVWVYALELCRALSVRGVDIVLATMGPPPDAEQRRCAARIPGLTLYCSTYRLEWMDEPWDEVERAGRWLLRLAEQETVDVIHLNGYSHAALEWRQPVVVAAHSCVCSWWSAVHGGMPPARWDCYRCQVERGLAHAAAVVAPTHAFMRQLAHIYSFSSPRCVIPNARSVAMDGVRAQAEKDPLVFACGRLWDEAKNLHVLDAVAQNIEWPVVVAGDVRSPDGREALSTAIQCIGRCNEREIVQWLQRAAIFAHPARYEPFGLAVLEAAHAGCALVLSDIDTLRETWDGAALFADATSVEAFGETLRQLISDAGTRSVWAMRAHQRAAQLTPAHMGEMYQALYRGLFRQSATARSCV